MNEPEKFDCERCCDMHVLYYVDRTEPCPKCIGPLEVITPTGCGTFPVEDPVQRSNEELFRHEDSKQN